MATHKDIDQILKGYLVSAFANAPEPKGTFVQFKGGEKYQSYFDIYVKSGENEIPLQDFKMDWHSRFDRMIKNMELSSEMLSELFNRSPEYFQQLPSNLPKEVKIAILIWERMQKKLDAL
ncbi:hypothetical protein CLV98_1239 [Dyadobacter jejuensis]|uniref:Uncharacterized protein n=1 Tax=Dyadobacter jejuensis TaxID=1082580 RepID=A0A316A651_9BACT|nr:hypothetical protein [Dyadobacter jejuensis]PWJ53396.1 hypothetical protein CLV98_1239 [Dyadobacter jejuensis]